MPAPLTARIPVKDLRGNLIDEKEVATYAGLLSRAHEEGLDKIDTSIIQFPVHDNGFTCICFAVVHTAKGAFTGIGDANPENVNRRVVPHFIRMAETRGKARTLRDAVNIGVVALEELGGDEPEVPVANPLPPASKVRQFPRAVERNEPAHRAAPQQRGDCESGDPMTENQRRWVFRALADRGFEGEQANVKSSSETRPSPATTAPSAPTTPVPSRASRRADPGAVGRVRPLGGVARWHPCDPKRGRRVRRGLLAGGGARPAASRPPRRAGARVLAADHVLFDCADCGCVVRLCRACYRYNRYCFDCAGPALDARMHVARPKHAATFRCRRLHAVAQARYRHRQRERVMDRGSGGPSPDPIVSTSSAPIPGGDDLENQDGHVEDHALADALGGEAVGDGPGGRRAAEGAAADLYRPIACGPY